MERDEDCVRCPHPFAEHAITHPLGDPRFGGQLLCSQCDCSLTWGTSQGIGPDIDTAPIRASHRVRRGGPPKRKERNAGPISLVVAQPADDVDDPRWYGKVREAVIANARLEHAECLLEWESAGQAATHNWKQHLLLPTESSDKEGPDHGGRQVSGHR